MQQAEPFSFVRRVSQIGTFLNTFFFGRSVGRDEHGNRYFVARWGAPRKDGSRIRQKRWVLYKGEPDPTTIPPEWYIWLHYTADAPMQTYGKKAWQKPREPNKTGTDEAWLPPACRGEPRPHARGDYQAWKPE